MKNGKHHGSGPTNRLVELARAKGYESAYEFATACKENRVTSYGLAYEKWQTGKAGKSQIDNLLAITRFLGASKVEEVFEM
jgi:hypothetical protein